MEWKKMHVVAAMATTKARLAHSWDYSLSTSTPLVRAARVGFGVFRIIVAPEDYRIS
jgi:hypothetical protein